MIEDLLYLLMGVEGKYIRFDDAALAIADVQFILDPTMGWHYSCCIELEVSLLMSDL